MAMLCMFVCNLQMFVNCMSSVTICFVYCYICRYKALQSLRYMFVKTPTLNKTFILLYFIYTLRLHMMHDFILSLTLMKIGRFLSC